MPNTIALHHDLITEALPPWARTLHPTHARGIVQRARAPYMDENSAPYSWYATALPAHREQLRTLIRHRDTCITQLSNALVGFKDITAFCSPLLSRRLGLNVAVDKAQYNFQPFETVINYGPGPGSLDVPWDGQLQEEAFVTRPVGPRQPRSLLEAALHNFESAEQVGPYSDLTCAPDDDTPLAGLSAVQFAGHCRDLNLGQQYQDHLQAIYEGPFKGQISQLSMRASQEELRVQAYIAWLKGLLSSEGLAAISELCNGVPHPVYDGHPLHSWRLSLLDVPLHEMLFIGADTPGAITPCIVYLPGDSEHPVREYPSRQAAAKYFRQRLVHSTFRQTVIGLAYRRDQPRLAGRLRDALFETDEQGRQRPRTSPNFHVVPSQTRAELWPTLYRAHLDRLKADARVLAVPTADVDAEVHQRHLRYWLEIGMNVLNIAAFFVPGLNAVMTGVFAYQLMDSVFTGFEAWEEGDTAQALAQVESLVINAAAIAGFAGAAKAIKASGFVDAMQAVWHEDRLQLWHPDMGPYASPVTLPTEGQPDAIGHYELEGKRYVVLEGTAYETFQGPDQQWRIRHPSAPTAYAPLLHHQGDGRWLLAHEQPVQWDDTQVLQRLGLTSRGLDSGELITAMRSTGADASVLRRMHAKGLRPPALLEDMLLRLRLDNEVQSLIHRVRNGLSMAAHKNFALPELLRLPGWPQDHVLKVFTGPEPWGDVVRYGAPDTPGQVEISLTRTDLENGQLGHAVVAQLDERHVRAMLGDLPLQQWAAALNARLGDQLQSQREAIYHSMLNYHAQPASEAAQPLRKQFPGVPPSALEEIVQAASHTERARLATGRVPLRLAEEARQLQARTRLDRAIIGLYRPHLANSDSQRLIEGLRSQHPQASAAQLLELAFANREHCAALIGQQPIKPGYRSPLRLAAGRIGYPLSGRGAGRAVQRLGALFPELDQRALRALQSELAEAGNLGTQISRLEAEQRTLRQDLNRWVGDASGLDDRFDRSHFAEKLLAAWSREGGASRDTLRLDRMRLRTLPALVARLPHVRTLVLDGLELERLEGGFLSCFPGLRALEVSGNPDIDAEGLFQALKSAPGLETLQLTGNALPALSPRAHEALAAMPGLRELNLRRNRLQLDAASIALLAGLRLDVLELGSNAITLDQTLASAFQAMVHPQQLMLDFNTLGLAPDVSYMARLRTLSLNNCGLQQWPEGLTQLMSQHQYQLRHLDLSMNRIRTLPNLADILRTPFARDVAAQLPERRWHLNYNRLEAQTRAQLRASGVRVFEHAPDMPEWQTLWRSTASTHQDQLWSDLFDQGENGELLGILERLVQSAEARHEPDHLHRRLWALLEKAGRDTALRERLADVARAYPPTCGDAGADAFSALEIEVLAHEAAGHSSEQAKTLLALYRKLYRRELVNELADRISLRRTLRKQALQNGVFDTDLPRYDSLDDPAAFPDVDLERGLVDDIEVRLALRQSLATRLGFPEPSRGMLYRDTARINSTIIDRVHSAVLAQDAVTDRRLVWIVGQAGWVHYLKRHNGEAFSLLTDFWRVGHDYLFHCLDDSYEPVTRLDASVLQALVPVLPHNPLDENGLLRRVPLNDGQFDRAMRALNEEQQKVEHGLLLSLTRQAETLAG
ncbi:NEL-type E3 ubiquitin ligase domain-containing protein [Pseudomonas putida]|uniref:NEL-type E3 ubiquitin ligase domain-containing protein n=1 Tax=Pseudomonas putida TaxID=303 RepID=UPI0029FF97D5|nr:hypothetical protein [Pseudomonas putida]